MKRLLANALMLLTATTGAFAQDAFDGVVSAILDHNAELQSKSKLIKAVRLDESDANSLDNPSVDFSRVWGRHGIGNKLQLDISQEFDWPGLYSARGKAADMGRAAAEMEYAAASLDMAIDVKKRLMELVFVRRKIAVIKGLKDNFISLNDAIDKGVRGGELTILDQRKMQIESYEIDNEMAGALSYEQQIISALQALSTAPLDLTGINSYPVQPLLSLQEYCDRAKTDPSLLALALASDQEALNAKAASLSRYPGFSVGYQHQAEMGDRFNGFTVGVKLPFFANRKARQAAIERSEAADMQRNMLAHSRKAEIEGLYAELQIHRERLDIYDKTFGDNKYLELLLKAYRGGQISVIEYLSELHYYHQTMLTYLESEYNYNLTLTTLNRNV